MFFQWLRERELSKELEDLIKIQKKRKDAFTSTQHHKKWQKTIATIDWKVSLVDYFDFFIKELSVVKSFRIPLVMKE